MPQRGNVSLQRDGANSQHCDGTRKMADEVLNEPLQVCIEAHEVYGVARDIRYETM